MRSRSSCALPIARVHECQQIRGTRGTFPVPLHLIEQSVGRLGVSGGLFRNGQSIYRETGGVCRTV